MTRDPNTVQPPPGPPDAPEPPGVGFLKADVESLRAALSRVEALAELYEKRHREDPNEWDSPWHTAKALRAALRGTDHE